MRHLCLAIALLVSSITLLPDAKAYATNPYINACMENQRSQDVLVCINQQYREVSRQLGSNSLNGKHLASAVTNCAINPASPIAQANCIARAIDEFAKIGSSRPGEGEKEEKDGEDSDQGLVPPASARKSPRVSR